jgi:hypothetical protein
MHPNQTDKGLDVGGRGEAAGQSWRGHGREPLQQNRWPFLVFQSTRPSMKARFDYITAILNVCTGEAV